VIYFTINRGIQNREILKSEVGMEDGSTFFKKRKSVLTYAKISRTQSIAKQSQG
jgi:hypothetical protein